MKTVYKVFLVLFVLFIAFNFYAIDYNLGFMHEDNTKYIFSLAAAILGLIIVFVMDTWSRVGATKK